MGTIEVLTPELAVAAAAIGRETADLDDAEAAINSAEGATGAFGGEPMGAAVAEMCGRASQAVAIYRDTVSALARNVQMASVGYVTTDEGVIPVKWLSEPEGQNP